MRVDVVIAGAGIGGAVLALALGRRGWRVAILERESATPLLARPEILWGATPRALDSLGIGDAVRNASLRLEGIEIGGDRPWLRITSEDFATADVEAFSTNPSLTRSMIAGAAVGTGNVEIHRGVSVEDLLYDEGRVAGVVGKRGDTTFEVRASLVVADDGGNSIVRTRLGIPIALASFPIEFVTAHIARWPLPPHRARVWIRREGSRGGVAAAGCIPWPGNEGILLLPLRSDRAQAFFDQSPEIAWSALDRITPAAAALREQLVFPRDFRRVARPFGHAESYVANGAALIGDASHPMTPAGGQGANAAIHDALALADVADAAFRSGDVSRERLLPYERLRRPVNAGSIAFSRRARNAFRAGGLLPLPFLLPVLARTIDLLGWPKRSILRSFATTFARQP